MIAGLSNMHFFWNSDILIFPTFKHFLSKILRKNLQVSKQILEVPINFYRFTNIYDLKFLDNETMTLWIFVLKFARKSLLLSKFCQMKEILKPKFCWHKMNCCVCSNGNESFTGRLLSNYGPLNMLFHYYWYLIYSVFH